jgi:polar amino acid transport system substrate-binding protein
MTPLQRLSAAVTALCLVVPAWAQKPAPAKAKATATQAAPATPRLRAPGDVLEAVRKRGALNVGIAPRVPWAMRDPAGEWQGYGIDLARQLASDLGVELRLVHMRSAHLTDALDDATIDIVGGYPITPQRALAVDFSHAYAQSPMQLVARVDQAERGFDRPDFALGVRAGGAEEATAQARFPNARIVTFPRERPLYEALKEGKVDGALGYSPRTAFAAADSGGRLAEMSEMALPQAVEAFAVRKGEQGLLNFLNAWIAHWKADGWLDERRRYWFDTLDWTARFRRDAPK